MALVRLNRTSGVKRNEKFPKIRHGSVCNQSAASHLFTHKQKPRYLSIPGFLNGEPDNVLLSLEIQPTIIGDKVFHCPVRNGKEWDHLSMVIRQRLCFFSKRIFDLDRNEARIALVINFLRSSLSDYRQSNKLHGYRIKLHEQLVLVS